MAIQVTCPSCLARFTVSDKYAGKSGPCPKCKKQIVIPDKSQEVVIHAPETDVPKDSKGVSVLKPIKRTELKFTPLTIGIAAGSSLLVFLMALGGRFAFAEPPTIFLALGAILLSMPISGVGYRLLKDDELGGYEGQELWIRVAACAGIFSITWGFYWFLAAYFGNKTLADVDSMMFAALMGGMLVLGTIASLACFEIEVPQALMHYAFYLGVTLFLAWVCGAELAEPLSKGDRPKKPWATQGR